MDTKTLFKQVSILSGLVLLAACSGGGDAAPAAESLAAPAPTLAPAPSPTPSASPSPTPSPSPSPSPTPYAYSGGSGTMADPYQISVPEDVQRIADHPAAYFTLKQSINMGSYSFTTIPSFSGTLYGNSYELDNLTISGTGAVTAMFGTMSGTIVQVKLYNATITGTQYAAAFAGTLSGLISTCSVTGTITSPSGGNGFNAGVGVPFYKTKSGGSVVSSTQDVYFNGNRVNQAPN